MDATGTAPKERQLGSREREGFLSLKLRPWNILTLFMVLACLATLAGCLGRCWWRFENIGSFKVQCCVFLALGVPVYWFGKRRNSAIVLAAFALANAAAFVPLYFGGDKPAAPAQFRVMLINVHTDNQQYAKVIQAIREARPNAVILLEVNDTWAGQLRALQDEYPFRTQDPRPDNFGIVLCSRAAPVESRILRLGEVEVPTVFARFDVAGKPLTVIGTHPVPPANSEYVAFRNEHMALLARLVAAIQEPVLLLGDLNMTSDSPVFQQFLRDSGLRDSRQGFGVHATWPTYLPPLRIAIDHCLVSEDLLVHDRRVGEHVGSDHFPVIVDLSLHE